MGRRKTTTTNKDRLTIKEFSLECGKSKTALYRYLGEEKFAERQREFDGSYTYDRTFLETMFRNKVFKGVRDIKHVYPVSKTRSIGFSFPGYSATSNGQIIEDKTGKALTQSTNSSGYKIVRLEGIRERHLVSRLVLTAFIGPRPTKVHQADHLNGIKTDNRLENLEWVTPKENMRRREKRLNVHPNTPNKYTHTEITRMSNSIERGETYVEFSKRHPEIAAHASKSTFDRKKKEVYNRYGSTGFPNWRDIPQQTRLETGRLCTICYSAEDLITHHDGVMVLSGASQRTEVTWGEVLFIMLWVKRMRWREKRECLDKYLLKEKDTLPTKRNFPGTNYRRPSLPPLIPCIPPELVEKANRLFPKGIPTLDEFHNNLYAALSLDYVLMENGRFVCTSNPIIRQLALGENPYAELTDGLDDELEDGLIEIFD